MVTALFGWPILDAVVYLSLLGMLLELETNRVNFDFRRPQFFLFIGLFVAALMSHLANTYIAGLLNTWIDAFRICFFGVLLFANLTSIPRLRLIARVFVVMALLMCVHAVLQQVRGFGFGGLPPVMSWRPGLEIMVPRSQFFGIFEDPNDLAQMFATATPLTFVFFKKKRFVWFLLACAVSWAFMQGIESCWSRGAYLSIMAAVGVVVTIRVVPRRIQAGTLAVLGCSVLLLLPLFAGDKLESSALDRVNFWGEANWLFIRKPIFGIGYRFVLEQVGRALHNAFVTCYTELGVFGYFFWFSLILLGAMGCLRTRHTLKLMERDAELDWLYRFSGWALASLAGFAVSSYFLSRAFVFPLFFLMAMTGAVPHLLVDKLDEAQAAEVSVMYSIRDTCVIGGITSLLSIVYIYISILAINAVR